MVNISSFFAELAIAFLSLWWRGHRWTVIIIIVIIMNFNRHSSHGHHGWKCHELAQHAQLTWIAHIIHSHTDINTVTTMWHEAPAQLLQNLESNFYFDDTWGRGSKPQYPEKKKPDSLPANRYHLFGEKIHHGNRTLTLQHWCYARLAKTVRRVWPTKLQTTAGLRVGWMPTGPVWAGLAWW